MTREELDGIIEQQQERIRELESKQNMLYGFLGVVYADTKEYPVLTDANKMINTIEKINKLMDLGMEI